LFKIRAFSMGNAASLLSSIGRGGLQFMLIIWLQGIWLPLHGYNFVDTPLWAGIYMLPLTAGFLVSGPASGWLSDRYGARPFATGGMILAALSFGLLMLLPTNFAFTVFALLLLLNGIGMGLFAAPNTTGIMNSVPANQRGAASGMRATFQNTGMVLSIGVFFSLMIVGMAASLPSANRSGFEEHHVPATPTEIISNEPPVGSLFAAFLGYNPVESMLKQVPSAAPVAGQPAPPSAYAWMQQHHPTDLATLTGKKFFPELIGKPFLNGLRIAFTASLIMCLIAAWASWLRGARYVHADGDPVPAETIPEEWVPA
jgi:MFS family permease